ncbi:MAG: flagellar biosynthesis protein FlhF [Aquificota bacterium]|nr:MAG: flagellar biosynthesis protein FlhF [Aquificota bacterium]
MKIKKLTANSLQEAVEEVKALYGSDAIILSTRVVKQRLFPFLPFPKRSVLEITVGIPDREDFSVELQKEQTLYEEMSKLKENLREVMELVKKQKVEVQEVKKDTESQYSIRAIYLMNKLINRGVSRDVAEKVVESACGYDFELKRLDLKGENYESLVEGFGKHIKTLEGFFDTQDFKVVALVGPTGVGKTTTIAKLSYLLKSKGKRVALITIDSFRVGATEQLRTYANLMELPFRTADTPYRLRECVGELSSMDVVFVDTGGRSQYNEIKVKELLPFFQKLPALHTFITVSANTEERVIYDVIENFSLLQAQGLIFTKLDETNYFGTVVNVAVRTQMPLLCLTTGQRVPEDLQIASPEYLAKIFLEG